MTDPTSAEGLESLPDASRKAILGTTIAARFRGFLPVVVDLETGGFNARTDALLEIAAVVIDMDEHGRIHPGQTVSTHVEPFEGANVEPKSLEITGIRLDSPLRAAREEIEALRHVFQPIRRAVRESGCQRAVLVAHNPAFDLSFLNAAVERTGLKRNPFHPFSAFDTATLGGLACGQTVLARAVQGVGLDWDQNEAHSAVYDCERTARLFCEVVNRWRALHTG